MAGNDAAIKAALVVTTATPGWGYIKQLGNKIVQDAAEKALDEEDNRERGEMLRLKAGALKKGFRQFFELVDKFTNWEEQTKDANFNLEQIETDLEELARTNA